MMVIAIGLSCYNIALFHLVNHAFYKALLFLGAGSVIHAVADNQDFRRYGGLRPFLPLTYSVMLIASLSLVAFPYMTGFYSKDLILESAYGKYDYSGTVVYIIATIGAMFTTLYSVKVLYLTFLTNPNGPLVNYKQAHEGDIFMSLPLMILAVFSIFFGFITKDMFIGLGSGFFSDNALFIHPSHEILLDTEFGVPTLFKLLPLIFTISLTIIAIVLSEFLPSTLIYFKLSRVGYNIFSFFNQRFLIEMFYNRFITGVVLKLGGQTTKVLDKGSVEYLGPYGLEKGLLSISSNIANLNTGVITTYALYIVIGIIGYLLCYSYINSIVFILVSVLSLSSLLAKNNIDYNPKLSRISLVYIFFFILLLNIKFLSIMFKDNYIQDSILAVYVFSVFISILIVLLTSIIYRSPIKFGFLRSLLLAFYLISILAIIIAWQLGLHFIPIEAIINIFTSLAFLFDIALLVEFISISYMNNSLDPIVSTSISAMNSGDNNNTTPPSSSNTGSTSDNTGTKITHRVERAMKRAENWEKSINIDIPAKFEQLLKNGIRPSSIQEYGSINIKKHPDSLVYLDSLENVRDNANKCLANNEDLRENWLKIVTMFENGASNWAVRNDEARREASQLLAAFKDNVNTKYDVRRDNFERLRNYANERINSSKK
jgi:NADH-ubiquinone oxidoreductase chain 5